VLPFARLEQLLEQVFHLPDLGRAHAPRMLLPSR
jgi:hypothetical protein